MLAEPLGRDWVDPLRDLRLRRRLDARLLSDGMLHVVDSCTSAPTGAATVSVDETIACSSSSPTMIRMAAPDSTSSLPRASWSSPLGRAADVDDLSCVQIHASVVTAAGGYPPLMAGEVVSHHGWRVLHRWRW